MKRFAEDNLVSWMKKEKRKPLIIRGARGSGKTWLVKEFGEKYFEQLAYFSFEDTPALNQIFETQPTLDLLMMSLSIQAGFTIDPATCLIVFDEIQMCPSALESLEQFYDDEDDYYVIATGSYLGTLLFEEVDFPVGKVGFRDLCPLSFSEFLVAVGQQEMLDLVDTGDWQSISQIHDKYLFWLKNYLYIGGMPQCVQTFIDTRDYKQVRKCQQSILRQYRKDISSKVDKSYVNYVLEVIDSLGNQLDKKNKKFMFSQIKPGARREKYELACIWSSECGLVLGVHKVMKCIYPLNNFIDLSSYKLFLSDVGLLSCMYKIKPKEILDPWELFEVNNSALIHQFVAQELIASVDIYPYYFNTKTARYEQDFMIEIDDRAVPIEVRSVKNRRSQGLEAYLSKFDADFAIRVSARQYEVDKQIINLPLYALSYLKQF